MAKLKLYGFDTWPTCPPAKEFLSQNGIEFNYVDVKANDENLQEFYAIRDKLSDQIFEGRFGVPAFLIDDHTILIGLSDENKEKVLTAMKG